MRLAKARPRPEPPNRRATLFVGLRERPEQPLEIRGDDADAGVGDGECQPQRRRAAGAAATASDTLPRSVNFTALSIRFSNALRSRTASPLTRAGRFFGDGDFDAERLAFGAGLERLRDGIDEIAQRERLGLQDQPAAAGLARHRPRGW